VGALVTKVPDCRCACEPFQRRIHRANRNLPTCPFFDLTADHHAIRIAPQPHDGEHHYLCERDKELSARHLFCTTEHTKPLLSSGRTLLTDRAVCSLMQNK